MGRRDYQSTVADALPLIIKEQAKTGLGSVKFTKKDKKSIGKIYFRAGGIYAIELSTYAPYIVHRIATNEFISAENRKRVLEKFGNNPSDTRVVEYVLKYQLVPEKPLTTYIKDYFLDAFDELYSWKDVNVEWRTNDEAPAILPKVPQANPQEIIDKLQQRKKYIETNLATNWSINPEEIGDLYYTVNINYSDPANYINTLLLEMGKNGEYTISEVAQHLGLPRFNTKLAIFKLWQVCIIDVIHPQGIRYSNRGEDEIQEAQRQAQQNNATPTTTTPEVQEPIQAVHAPIQPEPAPETISLEVPEAHPEPEQLITDTVELKAQINSIPLEKYDDSDSEPEIAETLKETVETQSVSYEPKPVINEPQEEKVEAITETPSEIEPEIEKETLNNSQTPIFDTVNHTTEPTYDIEKPETTPEPILEPETTPEPEKDIEKEVETETVETTDDTIANDLANKYEEQIKEIQMSTDTPASGLSRLQQIAEQLKAEIANLKTNIANAEKAVNNKQLYIDNLKSERIVLTQKIDECDKKISIEETALAEAQEEVSRLNSEYNSSLEFTKNF